MVRRSLAFAALSLATLLGLTFPAYAVTLQEKLAALSTPASTTARRRQQAGVRPRQNQGAWADYAFDWSTDLCSTSPDQPLGFDFRNAVPPS